MAAQGSRTIRWWRAFVLVSALLGLFCAAAAAAKRPNTAKPEKARAERAVAEAFAVMGGGDEAGAIRLFEKALTHDPWNANALSQIGMRQMAHANMRLRTRAMKYLAKSFDDLAHPRPVSAKNPQGLMLASTLGRYHIERKEYLTASKFLEMAAVSPAQTSHCQQIMLHSQIPAYATSVKHAHDLMIKYVAWCRHLLHAACCVLHAVRGWVVSPCGKRRCSVRGFLDCVGFAGPAIGVFVCVVVGGGECFAK